MKEILNQIKEKNFVDLQETVTNALYARAVESLQTMKQDLSPIVAENPPSDYQ